MSNHIRVLCILSAVVILTVLGCRELYTSSYDSTLHSRAVELSQKYMILDAHQDIAWRLSNKMADVSVLTKEGEFDWVRARKGGLDVVFATAYVPSKYEKLQTAKVCTEEMLGLIEDAVAKGGGKFVFCRSVEDVRRESFKDRVCFVLTIENGSGLEGDLENVDYFYNRGVRYITLVHVADNHICDSSWFGEGKWGGLSAFGREVVARMNRLGMMVDVSHASDEAFYEIVKLSKAPVVASHSACRHFTPGWQRNMSDEMIKVLAAKGGVIQINFGSMFVNTGVNARYIHRWEEIDAYIEANKLEGQEQDDYVEGYIKANPLGEADVKDVVANIDHVVKLVGIEHVGLGSDYEGLSGALPRGLEDVSCYPNLIYELLKAGYSESDIEKICSGNFLRVWSEVERVGRELKGKEG